MKGSCKWSVIAIDIMETSDRIVIDFTIRIVLFVFRNTTDSYCYYPLFNSYPI